MHRSSLKESLVKTYHDVEEIVEREIRDVWHVRLRRRVKHRVHSLRKRPDHHKDVVAFSFAFLITLMVFVGWYFISFPRIISSYQTNKKENQVLNNSTNSFEFIKTQIYNNNIQPE